MAHAKPPLRRLWDRIAPACRALLQAAVLMLACTFLVFLLQSIAGRNPGRSILGIHASQSAVDALNAELGADQPFFIQYLRFIGHLLQGDLGISYYSSLPVTDLLAERASVTGLLIAMGFALSLLISLGLTSLAVRRPGGAADHLVNVFVIGSTVMPVFWLGILLVMLIAIPTSWFPVGGYGETFPEQLRSLALPALTLGISLAPVQITTLRTNWVAAMHSPYVEAARSRGVSQHRLLRSHALPNSVTPLIAISAVQAGWAVFEAVVIESTFRLPGLGSGLVMAAKGSDYPVVNGTTLILAFAIVIIGFIADQLMRIADPRLRGGDR